MMIKMIDKEIMKTIIRQRQISRSRLIYYIVELCELFDLSCMNINQNKPIFIILTLI